MPTGVFRRVVIGGGVAWKVPRPRHFLKALRCNRWEREMWYRWRPIFKWETLCPVLFADPLGLLVVMPLAEQPIHFSEIEALPDYYPTVNAETKVEDYGRMGGAIVVLDYGLPDRDMVEEQRAYYRKSTSPAQVMAPDE